VNGDDGPSYKQMSLLMANNAVLIEDNIIFSKVSGRTRQPHLAPATFVIRMNIYLLLFFFFHAQKKLPKVYGPSLHLHTALASTDRRPFRLTQA